MYYIYIMNVIKFLVVFLLAYLVNNKLFFKLPVNNSYVDAFVRTCIFLFVLMVLDLAFNQKEGYANAVPFFSNPKNAFDYCMKVNSPPFMASESDTLNHCLSRVAGRDYEPSDLKPPKKVRFAC